MLNRRLAQGVSERLRRLWQLYRRIEIKKPFRGVRMNEDICFSPEDQQFIDRAIDFCQQMG